MADTPQSQLPPRRLKILDSEASGVMEVWQEYQQELAEKSAEYQWQTARLQDLKQEYNQAFALMAPVPPQQQQAPRRRARA